MFLNFEWPAIRALSVTKPEDEAATYRVVSRQNPVYLAERAAPFSGTLTLMARDGYRADGRTGPPPASRKGASMSRKAKLSIVPVEEHQDRIMSLSELCTEAASHVAKARIALF